ncbi:unnamed protein product [Rangifer tarandus platyrhynchus]|uniref:Uncharacterized protein n=1 Tax=Rangifer tarandus platyrhynchus TaxID=3082113 RepID=A0ABN8Z7F2_RANTA|nr:unnamed protein product [Rangifer tarandus platyrhynchus]
MFSCPPCPSLEPALEHVCVSHTLGLLLLGFSRTVYPVTTSSNSEVTCCSKALGGELIPQSLCALNSCLPAVLTEPRIAGGQNRCASLKASVAAEPAVGRRTTSPSTPMAESEVAVTHRDAHQKRKTHFVPTRVEN